MTSPLTQQHPAEEPRCPGCAELTPLDHATAVEVASLPDMVRGYEDVKLTNVMTYASEQARLLAELQHMPTTPRTQETNDVQ